MIRKGDKWCIDRCVAPGWSDSQEGAALFSAEEAKEMVWCFILNEIDSRLNVSYTCEDYELALALTVPQYSLEAMEIVVNRNEKHDLAIGLKQSKPDYKPSFMRKKSPFGSKKIKRGK